jgi:hypothetical protein
MADDLQREERNGLEASISCVLKSVIIKNWNEYNALQLPMK